MKKQLYYRARTIILLVFLALSAVLQACGGGGISVHIREAEEETREEITDDGRHMVEDRRKDFYIDYTLEPYTEIRLSDRGSEITSGSAAGVEITGGVIIIRKAGTYVLSGKLSDGMIYISADKEADVRLVLSGVTLGSKKGAPVYVEIADKCILSLAPDTENRIFDEVTGSVNGETLTAAVYSKEDLVINGSGSLTVEGNAKDGITSKDTLKIMEGKVRVTARDDALYGKEELIIRNGEVSITTGSGSSRDPGDSKDSGWFGGDEAETASSGGHALKSAEYIGIDGGRLTADSYNDGLHSGGDIFITGGSLVLSCGDDGLHADGRFQLDGGEVTVADSSEGCEAAQIVIKGGKLSVTALDDGLNASVSADSAAEGSIAEGSGADAAQEKASVTLNGGTVTLNAAGDGIDSNGDIFLAGGTLLMNGPAAEDSFFLNAEGELQLNGTELLLLGDRGFPEYAETAGQQRFLTADMKRGRAGDAVSVLDEQGQELITMTSAEEYSVLYVSLPVFDTGDIYEIRVNGKVRQRITVPAVIFSGRSYE